VRAAVRGARLVYRTSLGMHGGLPDETCRTPWLAAGCNKPATFRAEQAVEVVENHEDGTRADGMVPGCPMRTSVLGSGRAFGMSVEGGSSNPREVALRACFGRWRAVPADTERFGACKTTGVYTVRDSSRTG